MNTVNLVDLQSCFKIWFKYTLGTIFFRGEYIGITLSVCQNYRHITNETRYPLHHAIPIKKQSEPFA